MTLDEAIKHAEEVVEEQKELYRLCPASESEIYCDGTKDCKVLENGKNKGCQKSAKEYHQLVEWLKDYKRLLEQEPIRDMEEIAEIMRCNADAETKCKMISNILTAKPHYFESKEGYGYWRAVYQGDEIINYRCTKCEFGNTFGKSTYNMNFCPFCGVKIIGVITDNLLKEKSEE